MRERPVQDLLSDLRSGNIPQVTWILPPGYANEHPDNMPAAGERYTHRILQALWANPKLWAKTALILNYDENDGLFDHVAPPTPEPETPGEIRSRRPDRVGLPRAVPRDLALEPRRLRLQRHVRPHIGAAPAGSALRSRSPETSANGAARFRAT
jgi:hypothetical protein